MNENKLLRNVKIYSLNSYLISSVLFWNVITLFYVFKGLDFLQIALIQSIGSVFIILLEIPMGYLSDKIGHNVSLKISSLFNFIAVVVLAFGNSFAAFLAAELLFAVASASSSGSDLALFYDSLKELKREDDYVTIRSKIRGRQAIIRFISRLIGPLLFYQMKELPFYISAGFYFLILLSSLFYSRISVTEEEDDEDEGEKQKLPIFTILKKHKTFIFLSIVSALILILVSNYSQYIGPFLEERGLDIRLLGVVTALASVADYLGTKISNKVKAKNPNVLLMIFGLLIALSVAMGGLIKNSLISAIVWYVVINLVHTPFTILLSDLLNRVISSKYRATFLSISNQIDEFFEIISDPFIGFAIDMLGFSLAYVILGGSFFALLFVIMLFVMATYKKSSIAEEVK